MTRIDGRIGSESTAPAGALETIEKDRLSRRAALRRLGIVIGAGAFGLVAADDVARMAVATMNANTSSRGLADQIARELRSSGVAFAQGQSYCGIAPVPCYIGPREPETGDCIYHTDCNNCGDGPCCHCVPPSSNCDCAEVAFWRKCNCMQAAANQWPDCVDCSGQPNGGLFCLGYDDAEAICIQQYYDDMAACE